MPPLKVSNQKVKNATVIIHHAPEVRMLATTASARLQKLLSLCDRQIEKLDTESKTDETASNKEAKSLIRLVLSLHKNLDHYTEILHPSTFSTLSPSLPVPTDILIRNLSRETAGESPAEGGGDYQCPKKENQTQFGNTMPVPEKAVEEKVADVSDSIPPEHSMSVEQGLIDRSSTEKVGEMTTGEWEETEIAKIEESRQAILKDIEAGKLTQRHGLEIIGNMEWRFKRELEEKQAADRNRKSGTRWATG